MPIRVVVADDHLVVRVGVQAILEAAPDLLVVGVADCGEEAQQLVERQAPDVLVLDMSMPDMSGAEVLQKLQASGSAVKILALSAYDDDQYVFGTLQSGAAGYVLKDDASISLVEAVRGVARGDGGWFSRRVLAKLLRRERSRQISLQVPIDSLSTRERQILVMVARGLSNARIADTLALSAGTVKNHLTQIYDKLGVQTRTEAVAWFWQSGMVSDAPPHRR